MTSELFPFSQKRQHQAELLSDVKQVLESGGNLLANAPTGLGKTAAVLSPSLAYALDHAKTVFFLTPRHSQHRIAIETLQKINDRHETSFSSVDLIGKKWLCPVEAVSDLASSDFQNYCKTLREDERCTYYNKTIDKDQMTLTSKAEAKLEQLKNQHRHAEELKQTCSEFCVYELLLHLMQEAEVVIGDYYHLFHPGVRDSILTKINKTLSDAILIIDEAHNLPSRVRDLLSWKMSNFQISKAAKEASSFSFYQLEEALKALLDKFEQMAREELDGNFETKIKRQNLIDVISNIYDYEELIGDLEELAEEVHDEKKRSYASGLQEFLERWQSQEKGFARILRKSDEDYVSLSYKCLDPQISTKDVFSSASSSILMSGTLVPLKMYQQLSGISETNSKKKKYPQPFPQKNRLTLAVDTVTTRYSERDETMYSKIAWYIRRSLQEIPGNSLVFFPSYSLRDAVRPFLEDKIDKQMLIEERGSDKEAKKELISQLHDLKSDQRGEGALLLGVIAGSFDQGIDYHGGLANSVFVVGLPLKKPDLETQTLIDYYDYKFGRGWDYGYSYPAVIKAMQAAGRCIRSKKDRGAILLLDKRYLWQNYHKVLPPDFNLRQTRKPWQELRSFF